MTAQAYHASLMATTKAITGRCQVNSLNLRNGFLPLNSLLYHVAVYRAKGSRKSSVHLTGEYNEQA